MKRLKDYIRFCNKTYRRNKDILNHRENIVERKDNGKNIGHNVWAWQKKV